MAPTNRTWRTTLRARWTTVAAVAPVVVMAGTWTAVAQPGHEDASTQAGAGEARVSVPDVPRSLGDAAPVALRAKNTTPLGPTAVTSLKAVGPTADQDIPTHAVAAYRKAATVLAASQATCRLPWSLVAAIGKVESNHGRFGGNAVGTDGVSRPGIRGIALDGSNDTARILDTDRGSLDQDATYDRAVGPMQFIPSTWSAVAVDGDADGVKNPQDVDDAAASAGVYLCAGGADLSTPAGARSAVLSYNRSTSYADLVLSIAARYATGDYSEAPDNVRSPVLPGEPVEPRTPEKGKTEPVRPVNRGEDLATPGAKPPVPRDVAGRPAPWTPPKPAVPATPAKPGTPGPTTPAPTTPTTPGDTPGTPPTGTPASPSEPTPDPEPTPETPSPTTPEETTPTPEPEPERATVDGNDEVRNADAAGQRGQVLPLCDDDRTPAGEPCVVKIEGTGEDAPSDGPTDTEESTAPEGDDTDD